MFQGEADVSADVFPLVFRGYVHVAGLVKRNFRRFAVFIELKKIEFKLCADLKVNAAFRFASGLTGSASWCFVAHESSRADKIEVLGEKGTIVFSVYNYNPIRVYSESGNEEITIANPQYVQMNLIQQIVDHLRGTANCDCDSVSATTANWVMDKILGKF